ncbi:MULTISPECIES: heat shock protein HspQ [unclassified Brevundimonas]|uniref:heat shock protein HspQ n=1 Tax=unclassified Brevundimonas TaxID=2622653 RepID=UPI0025BFAC6F|nr:MULTISPECIES: heat shock protein HspQ [unclassified Brevundimonas]
MINARTARFGLGQKVRHIHHAFYGLVLDVDARYEGAPEDIGSVSPEQPFYSVMIEGEDGSFIAYAAEESIVMTEGVDPITEQEQLRLFNIDRAGRATPRLHLMQ